MSNSGCRMTLLMLLVMAANDAAAQTPARSFNDLLSVIKAGQHVTVLDSSGQEVRGAVASLKGSELEIQRRRWRRLLRQERLIFSESSVRRIVHHDSEGNGLLIGLGLGALVGTLLAGKCGEDAVACDYVTILSPVGGLLIGTTIDGAVTRTLYLAPGATP